MLEFPEVIYFISGTRCLSLGNEKVSCKWNPEKLGLSTMFLGYYNEGCDWVLVLGRNLAIINKSSCDWTSHRSGFELGEFRGQRRSLKRDGVIYGCFQLCSSRLLQSVETTAVDSRLMSHFKSSLPRVILTAQRKPW